MAAKARTARKPAAPKPEASPKKPSKWRAPRLAVDAIVATEEGVLLVERRNEPFQGQWALPGGFVDGNEAPEDAVVRELEEECAVKARVRGLVGVYGRPGRDPRGHVVSIVYDCELLFGEPEAGDDAADAKVWPLTMLPDLAFDHARILADWQGRRKA